MSSIPSGERTWVDNAADRFEQQWTNGPQKPLIEDFLAEAQVVAEDGRRAHLVEELVRVECELRRAEGEEPKVQEYRSRFPDEHEAVAAAFGLDRSAAPRRTVSAAENMLLGLLALQNHFIDRDALVGAFDAWVTDKSKSLGQILRERKALSPARFGILEALVQDHIQQHGCDPEKSLAELRGVPEVRERLERVVDLDFQCSLMSLRDAAGIDPDATTDYRSEEDEAEDPEGRFQIVRFHDRGALGEVYLARDQQLHRIVALKRIRSAPSTDKDKRARFVVEAEITGRLEHPGIVPVYSLGAFNDGRPFYAMRFIRGDNLTAAIDRFHRDEQAGRHAGARTLALQKLLRRFLDVCNAIAYAHSRGVVHRDLKPGNIMLGQYGETLVVDWGLAKSVGRPEQLSAPPSLDDRTLVPETGSDLRQTQEGSRLGTPAYMSPEQAAGRINELGPPSDVYSLGATLYCVLTGLAPFEEHDLAKLLHRVERGDFVPPRQLQAWVDPALEAICLKAMKTDPAQRYATPRALADDVEHWLADEPVAAYPEPMPARVRRWMRKHPSRVTAAVVLLLATVAGLAAGTVLLSSMNRRIQAQKAVADSNFEMARNAVDQYFTRVSQEPLLDDDRLKPLRKDLLNAALEFYQKFIKQRENDRTVRRDLANTHFRAGVISVVMGKNSEGEAHVKRGAEVFDELIARTPEDRGLRQDLADGLAALASAQREAGYVNPALANYTRAVELMEQLWAEDPSDFSRVTELVRALSHRVFLKNTTGDEEGGAGDIRQAEKILEKVRGVSSHGEKDAILGVLAEVYYRGTDMGKCLQSISILRGLDSRKSAAEVGAPASKLGRWGWGFSPQRPRWLLRGALQNAGNFLNFSGHPAKAEPLLRESVDIVRAAIRENPQSDQPLVYLQTPLGNLGESFFLQGQIRAAKKALEEVLALRDELRRREIPFGVREGMNYVEYAYFLACAEGESGDFSNAISHCGLAMQVAQEARTGERGVGEKNPVIVNLEAWTREARSRFEFATGKIGRDELINRQRQVVAERKGLRERPQKGHDSPSQYASELNASAAVLADDLLDSGRVEEALAVVNEVLPDQQRLVENDKPDNRDVPDHDLRDYAYRRVWADLVARKAEALARTAKSDAAAQSIRQAIEIIKPLTKPEPCYLYDLAHYLTLASTLPANAGLAKPAHQAVDDVRKFIASGFDNPYKLKHDPRLEPLRKREDFVAMVRDLEAKLAAETKK
jgi:serine/threonine-protein kinase